MPYRTKKERVVKAKHKLEQFEMPSTATVTDLEKSIEKAPVQRLHIEAKTMQTVLEAISRAKPAECKRVASLIKLSCSRENTIFWWRGALSGNTGLNICPQA